MDFLFGNESPASLLLKPGRPQAQESSGDSLNAKALVATNRLAGLPGFQPLQTGLSGRPRRQAVTPEGRDA